ncbi:MAG: DUF1232 domain-containing protein [Chthoniobacterales bacterium]|nr:DUF1232 domain-containing protein [Chthoniobacterales bacterium]
MKTPEPAVSTDEFIIKQSRDTTADELRGLRRFVGALDQKKKAAAAGGHPDLAEGVATLGALLASPEVTDATDPLPPHLAEAGAALRYVLKGIDIIPDSVPGLGLADDEWIVTRVMQRNPVLRVPTS